MGNDNCAYCNQKNVKVLITSDKYDSLEKNQNAICDTDYDLYFENFVKYLFLLIARSRDFREELPAYPIAAELQCHKTYEPGCCNGPRQCGQGQQPC